MLKYCEIKENNLQLKGTICLYRTKLYENLNSGL